MSRVTVIESTVRVVEVELHATAAEIEQFRIVERFPDRHAVPFDPSARHINALNLYLVCGRVDVRLRVPDGDVGGLARRCPYVVHRFIGEWDDASLARGAVIGSGFAIGLCDTPFRASPFAFRIIAIEVGERSASILTVCPGDAVAGTFSETVGGRFGCLTVIVAVWVVVAPRSSVAVQVTVMVCGVTGTVMVALSAVGLPITPAVASHSTVTGSFVGSPTVARRLPVCPISSAFGTVMLSVGGWFATIVICAVSTVSKPSLSVAVQVTVIVCGVAGAVRIALSAVGLSILPALVSKSTVTVSLLGSLTAMEMFPS